MSNAAGINGKAYATFKGLIVISIIVFVAMSAVTINVFKITSFLEDNILMVGAIALFYFLYRILT